MPPAPMTAMRKDPPVDAISPVRGLFWAGYRDHPRREIMPQPTSPARELIRGTVPKLAEISDQVIYGDVWERPGLSKRDRSLITVAALVATGREKQLEGHLGRALANGVTKDELSELITHLAFYAGWPAAMTAALIAKEVFESK